MMCLCRSRGEADAQIQAIRNSALEGGGWPASHSGGSTPGKDAVHIVQAAGWRSEPVWTARKISPPPGFNLRNVQLVASPYTDWAVPAAVVK
jgi:hypothetical protein